MSNIMTHGACKVTLTMLQYGTYEPTTNTIIKSYSQYP